MWNSRPVRLLWHSFSWLTRGLIVGVLSAAVLFATTIIGLRYWLLPNIDQYHPQITAHLTRTLGHPVVIDQISADWRGLSPHLTLLNLSLLDERQHPALVLPSVQVSVSWLSVLTAELRLASLEIERPELLIRRDVAGNLSVGGIAVETRGGDGKLADWLLHQSRMVARNALIVWQDEQRGAPPLVLESVDVRIESLFNHHRFALHAVAPAALASPLDVRGDFHGSSFSVPQAWRGQVFTQLQYVDMTAWRPWFDLPTQIAQGRGAVRAWLDFAAAKPTRLQVDLAVRDVVTRLADDVPEMHLKNLRGRAIWHALAGGFELETKKLRLQLADGVALPNTDIYLRLSDAQAGQASSGEVRASVLQLETLLSLSNFLPIPADLRAKLDAFAPRGRVDDLMAQWQGTAQQLSDFRIQGKLQNIALNQVGELPGFTGLTATIEGNQDSGRLLLDSRQVSIHAPGVLREPVAFHSLAGNATWRHENGHLQVDVAQLAVSNAEVEGRAHGSYRTAPHSPGILDLNVDLTRAEVRQVARYTPLLAVNKQLSDWLHDALLAGRSNDFHLRIAGDLNDFPFERSATGTFELSAHVQGGAVQFDKTWPSVENINGLFSMRGKQLDVVASQAASTGVPLHDLSVRVPDITLREPALAVKLRADAPTRDFLKYVQHSPVRDFSGGFTDAIRAQGEGRLDLSIDIPRLGVNAVEVKGGYVMRNNEVDLGGRIPLLRKVNGELKFTQAGIFTHQLMAEMLGGPTQIEVKTTAEGQVLASLSGSVNLDAFARTNPHPVWNDVHGSSPWTAQVAVANQQLSIKIASGLQGVSSTLPAPFAKAKNEVMPLAIELKSVAVSAGKESGMEAQNNISVELGKLLSAKVIQTSQHGTTAIKRAVMSFYGTAKWPDKEGIWLNGNLPELSVQGWAGLFGGVNAAGTGGGVAVDGADLRVAKLTGYGQVLDNLHVVAGKRGDGAYARLSSPGLNGELFWQAQGFQNGGKLVARLSNLDWATGKKHEPPVAGVPTPDKQAHTDSIQPGALPALDVSIERLNVGGKPLGRLDVVGYPEGEGWRLRRLLLTNPDGSLGGDGTWSKVAGQQQTHLNLLLTISDAGKILDRSGYPNTVKNGKGTLHADLVWRGSPASFELQTLEGKLKLDTGAGRFLKIDPGAGKLLSVLSLQALPKHIALDFTDVFSNGFQFDAINGNASIHAGHIATQDFKIDGSAAKVLMKGNVDLIGEMQDLRVEVLPTIGSGISLIGAFVINPVVGVSAFIVDKILGNPLDKLVSFEYNVSGTWADPNVVKVGEKSVPIRTQSTPAENASEPAQASDKAE